MGSTGARIATGMTKGYNENDTYEVQGAKAFKGVMPHNSGLEAADADKVTLSMSNPKKKNIIFQFKLVDNGRNLNIKAYDPNTGKKANVTVNATAPSISRLQATGTKAQKQQATNMKQLMNQSSAGISDASLTKIAAELRRRES